MENEDVQKCHQPGSVAQAFNLGYSEDKDWEDCGSRPAQTESK
jgi:hypothetical protein